MLSVILPVLLAVASGASIVVQQALNINLRAALSSAAWSGLVSYAVGCVCMAMLILALRDPVPAASVATRIPWWAWSGGLFGAIFIGLAILLVPQLGAATFALRCWSPARCSLRWPSTILAGWVSPNARSTCRRCWASRC